MRLLHVPKSEMEEQVRLGTLAVPGSAAKMRNRLLRSRQDQIQTVGYMPTAGPAMYVPTMMQPGGSHAPLVLMPHVGASGTTSLGAGMARTYVSGTAPTVDTRLW